MTTNLIDLEKHRNSPQPSERLKLHKKIGRLTENQIIRVSKIIDTMIAIEGEAPEDEE